MKKYLRTLALFLVLASLMSVCGAYAFADGLQSAGEVFAEFPYNEDGEETPYRQLAYRVCQFDEEILMPSEVNVFNTYDGETRYVQGKYGMARGQKLYDCPDENAEARWFVRDGCRVIVYGEKNGFYFVELQYYEKSEGTFAWIPVDYVVDEWSFPLSVTRTGEYGGW